MNRFSGALNHLGKAVQAVAEMMGKSILLFVPVLAWMFRPLHDAHSRITDRRLTPLGTLTTWPLAGDTLLPGVGKGIRQHKPSGKEAYDDGFFLFS